MSEIPLNSGYLGHTQGITAKYHSSTLVSVGFQCKTHWYQSERVEFGWNITTGPQILTVEGESVWNLPKWNEGAFRQFHPRQWEFRVHELAFH